MRGTRRMLAVSRRAADDATERAAAHAEPRRMRCIVVGCCNVSGISIGAGEGMTWAGLLNSGLVGTVGYRGLAVCTLTIPAIHLLKHRGAQNCSRGVARRLTVRRGGPWSKTPELQGFTRVSDGTDENAFGAKRSTSSPTGADPGARGLGVPAQPGWCEPARTLPTATTDVCIAAGALPRLPWLDVNTADLLDFTSSRIPRTCIPRSTTCAVCTHFEIYLPTIPGNDVVHHF